MNIGVLTAKLELDSSGFQKGAAAAASTAKDFGKQLTGIGTAMTAGLTVPIAALGAALLKVGMDFDDAFDRIRIGTGATGAALAGLEQSFRNVVANVPASFEAASQAMTQLAQRTGLAGSALEGLTRQELELSRITGAELGPQIDATSRLFTNWAGAIESPSAALDFLFKVSQKTGIGVTELAQVMTSAGAPLRALGFGFEQSAVLMGTFDQAGVDAGKATMALTKALTEMMQKGIKDPAAAFGQLIETIRTSTSETEALRIATELFGTRAAVQMVDSIRQGRFAIDEMTGSLLASKESILGAASDTMDFTEQLQLLKNQAYLAAEPLAKNLFKALNDLMPAFKVVLDEVAKAVKWFSDLPGPVKTATAAILLLAAVGGPIAVMAGSVIRSLGAITGAMGVVKGQAISLISTLGGVSRAAALIGKTVDSDAMGKMAVRVLGLGANAKQTTGNIIGLGEHLDELAFIAGKTTKANGGLAQSMGVTSAAMEKFGNASGGAAKKVGQSWTAAVAETALAFTKIRANHAAFMTDLFEATRESTLKWLEMRKSGFEQTIEDMKNWVKESAQLVKLEAEMRQEAESKYVDSLIESIKARGRAIKEEEKIAAATTRVYDDMFNNILGGWADFANKTLGILNQMNSKIPNSLGGLLEKITGLFTKSTATAQKWAAGISGIMGGVATFMGSRNQGKVAGVMGGAMGGLQTGMAIGSLVPGIGTAIGAGVGALIGGIAGLFGSGKSAAQKAEEERQKKQMAMDMEKTAIDITSSAIDSMHKALEMFKSLADHVDVPKQAIKSFFKTLEKVTKEFLSLAGKFAKDNMEAAKVFAESMGPVVGLMAGSLEAFNSLRFYTSIPEKAITSMAADLGRAAEAMGAVAIAVEDHIEKKAKRFAERVMPVVELIASAFTAFETLNSYKGVMAATFTSFFADVTVAVNMMGELADELSRNFLNKAKTYSERITVIVQTIGASVAALTSLRTYEAVPQAAFAALEHDIMAALTMIDRLVIAGEQYLDRAITFQHLMEAVAGALSAGAGALRSVSGAVSPGVSGTDAISLSPGRTSSPASGGSGTVINVGGLTYTAVNPAAQRVIDSVQELLGQSGLPTTSRAY